MDSKKYHVISEDGSVLTLYEPLADDVHFILWYNTGLFGIISHEKVQNINELLKDSDKLPQLSTKREATLIHWDDTIQIPAKIGELLFNY